MNKNLLKCVPLAAIVLLLILSGCGTGVPSARTDEKQAAVEKVELTVSAAASLTEAMKEIQTVYERSNKNVKLQFNFGASGTLQQQIEQGAPADLFISASTKNMKALTDRQLIQPDQQKTLLLGELVLIVPADGKTKIEKLEDLNRPEIHHIAAGEPETVPAGGYAKEALTKAKLWEPLQPKLVLGKDVRQVLTYVESGNAEAGFVYRTDALTSAKVKVALPVDPGIYSPIEYPAGIVKATKHAKEAQALYSFLQSKEAKDIFVKYGFSIPK
ncbi:molybdate ABC transporter substrate-binding protein [Paenibacillus filicis]|uniref:Molybdate ABC transporter substrate-binding protein n=1 Tax=Paenibacillus gyeongsangnamensis TaxID=3388067 RepID=A0ABT4Q833_9BACL|nr:molybdate ABC transporter substrate-binding protein [Paenibacillus filicis]MCZ8513032.1 molybdate ABC transporter substrate-binding protein [Paenibacillus filicis]